MAEYRIEIKDGLHIIYLPAVVEAQNGGIEDQVKVWLEAVAEAHVLDFTKVIELKNSAYRPLMVFIQALKKLEKSMFCVNVPKVISMQMNQDGLSSTFIQLQDIGEVRQKLKPKSAKATIDVEFINPFITAAQDVLATQTNTVLNPGRPYIKKANENLPMEIAGVISLSDRAFVGSISLCFTAVVFFKIYENMVGEKHNSITSEIEDAAGELLNIIFGHAKTTLNKQGHSLERAIPSILSGEKLRLRHQTKGPVIVLPFESAAGLFHIEVAVEQERAKFSV